MKIAPNFYTKLSQLNPLKNTISKTVSNPVVQTAVMSTAAASAIMAATAVSKSNQDVTVETIGNKLVQNGYSVDKKGNYSKKLSEEELEVLNKKLGMFALNYKVFKETPLKKADIEEFKNFINIDETAGKKLFNNNFDNLLYVYLIIKNNNLLSRFNEKCSENKNYYKLIENIVKNPACQTFTPTIANYKIDCSSDINNELRKKAINPGHEIDPILLKDITKLSCFIDSQPLPEGIKLYRGEKFEVLEKVKTSDGTIINLAKVMQDAQDDPKKVQDIREFVLDNELQAEHAAYMSTSLDKSMGEAFAVNRLCWELDVKPGTKGLYADALNLPRYYANENEVLLQKGSKLDIKDIDYDRDTETWILKASVSN